MQVVIRRSFLLITFLLHWSSSFRILFPLPCAPFVQKDLRLLSCVVCSLSSDTCCFPEQFSSSGALHILCMEGRNGMTMSGPASYYMHSGMATSGSGSQTGLHSPPGMRPLPSPSTSLPARSTNVSGGGSVGPAFQMEPSPTLCQPGVNIGNQGSSVAQAEPVKRKRGRPRKYGPDGTMSLGLSPLSSTSPGAGSSPGSSAMVSMAGSGSAPPPQKRGRGRPPGTGRKQQLASCGELMHFVFSFLVVQSDHILLISFFLYFLFHVVFCWLDCWSG